MTHEKDAEIRLGIHMDVSENDGTPKSSIFNRVFHYKPSIWGYPYFWKHPYESYELIYEKPIEKEM